MRGHNYNTNYGRSSSVSWLNTVGAYVNYMNTGNPDPSRGPANAVGGGGGSSSSSGTSSTGSTPPKPARDENLYKDLQEASKTGRGVTKADLKTLLGMRDGGNLNDAQKESLKQASTDNLFATKQTADKAGQIASGKQTMSILAARAAH